MEIQFGDEHYLSDFGFNLDEMFTAMEKYHNFCLIQNDLVGIHSLHIYGYTGMTRWKIF